MSPDLIYALLDPRDNSVRYIGKTCALKNRFNQHLIDKYNLPKYNWIQELKGLGYLPVIEIIHTCTDEENGNEIERTIICRYLKEGSNLFNMTKTVEGVTICLTGNEIGSLGIITDDLADRLINYINANRDSY